MNLKKISQFAFGPICSAALGFIILPITTWYFSIEDIGRVAMLQVTVSLCTTIFSFSMHQAYVREYYEAASKTLLLKAAITPGILLIFITLIVLFFLPWTLSEIVFGIRSSYLTTVLIVAILAAYVIHFLTHVLRMEERGLEFSASQIMPKIILLIGIFLIVNFNGNKDTESLITINVCSIIVTAVFFMLVTKSAWFGNFKDKLDIVEIIKMLRFSLPLLLGSLCFWGLTHIDRYFLRIFNGYEELGLYAVTASFGGAVALLSTVFSNLWHPVVYKWAAKGKPLSAYEAMIERMTVFVAVIWSFFGITSWVLVYFIPPKYAQMEYLILAYIAYPIFYMLSETTVVGVGISRKTKYIFLASLLALMVNVVLNYILIPNYGASGASIATLISFLIFFVVRTEVSVLAWQSPKRFKTYLTMLLYSALSLTFIIKKENFSDLKFLWIIMLFAIVIIFYKRIKFDINLLRNHFRIFQ